jgi:thiol:disulfide interchange protein
MRSRITALALLVSLAMAASVFAQQEATFDLSVDRSSAKAGETITAVVEARVQPGWHMYSVTQPSGGPIPTTVRLSESPVFETAGDLVAPAAESAYDPNFDIQTEYYHGVVHFRLPVKIKETAPAGKQDLTVRVRYMLCSDTMCLPPQTETLRAEVTIAAAAPTAATARPQTATPPPGAQPPATRPAPVQPPPAALSDPGSAGAATPVSPGTTADSEALPPAAVAPVQPIAAPATAGGSGLPLTTMAYVWFAIAMGGLALLTPCVFPMIPITVSYFTKRQSLSRGQAIFEAFMYSVGIILTFTLLGFGLTFLFGAGGINRLAASPLVNIAIALVFIVFALSLFGAFEIRLPSSWLTAVDRKSSRTGGMFGIMLMALTFSLTSFTCTVPFVGTVMVAALQGDWLWSLLGISVFATVFSAPFFLLAVFPSVLKSLPKSGNWMNSVKITMAFLELGAAMKFISNVDLVYQWEFITRPVFIAVWLAIALLTSIYLLGWFRFPHEMPTESIGVGRVFSSIFFLTVSFWLFRGLLGFPLGELDAFLPPRDYGGVHAASLLGTTQSGQPAEERWLTNYEEALVVARQQNRAVFVDFTGYTCTNCRWMESNIFPLPDVRELFSRYVLVRLYTDGPNPEHEANLEFERERFGTIALPYYAIMSPDDRIIATFGGLTRNPATFIEFLRKGVEPMPSEMSSQRLPSGAF